MSAKTLADAGAMIDPDESRLIREATTIFLRLRDAPQDDGLQREKELFLKRGQAERDAYAKMLEAWQVTGPKQKRSRTVPLILAFVCAASAFWWAETARFALVADHSSDLTPIATELASGDKVILDADSAIADNSDGGARAVKLLKGAAFFDVAPGEKPFVVTSGDTDVRVLGTSFEVGQVGDASIVAVVEGRVSVTHGDRSWQLSAGEQWVLSEGGFATVSSIQPKTAAGWRDGLLVTDGLNLAQVAEIIDRRLPGSVVVLGDQLGDIPVLGTFDLSNPLLSLKTLAELEGAQVISIPYAITFVIP